VQHSLVPFGFWLLRPTVYSPRSIFSAMFLSVLPPRSHPFASGTLRATYC
jgi:hypothetical protein